MKHSRPTSVFARRLAVMCACVLLAAGLALLTLSSTQASQLPLFARPATLGSSASLTNTAVFTIGVAGDLTGPNESYLGWPVANAVQLAINQANAAGGVATAGVTYTLSLVMADSAAGSGCNATQAITAANALLSAGVSAVVGYNCSNETRAVEPIFSAAGVPLICASCTAPHVTQQGYNIMFRTVTHDGSPASLLASYYRKWLRLSRSAIVEGSAGSLPGNAYQNAFTALGGTITSRRVVANSTAFTSTLSAIQAENPDSIAVINFNLDATAGGQFSRAAYDIGMTNVIIGWSTWTNDESVLGTYASAAGTTAVQGNFAAMEFRRTQDMPGWPTFFAAYTAAGFPIAGADPGIYGPFGYDAARIVIDALVRAGSSNPSAVRAAIASTQNYQGVVGTYKGFDSFGDVIPQWEWLERYQNGQWVILNPSQLFLPLIQR